jgi:hypothetical protein
MHLRTVCKTLIFLFSDVMTVVMIMAVMMNDVLLVA